MAHTFKKVVIAIDGTPLSKHAWEVAQTQILNKGDAIEFLVVHEPVIHSIPFDGYYEMIYDADQAVRSHLHKVVKPYVKEAESAVRLSPPPISSFPQALPPCQLRFLTKKCRTHIQSFFMFHRIKIDTSSPDLGRCIFPKTTAPPGGNYESE